MYMIRKCEFAELGQVIANGNKVQVIKLVAHLACIGLKEGKKLTDKYIDKDAVLKSGISLNLLKEEFIPAKTQREESLLHGARLLTSLDQRYTRAIQIIENLRIDSLTTLRDILAQRDETEEQEERSNTNEEGAGATDGSDPC